MEDLPIGSEITLKVVEDKKGVNWVIQELSRNLQHKK